MAGCGSDVGSSLAEAAAHRLVFRGRVGQRNLVLFGEVLPVAHARRVQVLAIVELGALGVFLPDGIRVPATRCDARRRVWGGVRGTVRRGVQLDKRN